MTSPPRPRLLTLPASAQDVTRIAERAIGAAGAAGKLPTPMEDLVGAAGIKDEAETEGLVERFLSTLDEGGRMLLMKSIQKLRGIADMRERVIYVPGDKPPREQFARAHELGHQLLPWHVVKDAEPVGFYHDDNKTLSPETRDLFEAEANFFAGEVIFQGERFARRARDYAPSFGAVLTLADQHGASTQATLRRYIEVHDEIVAAVEYLPNTFRAGGDGEMILHKPRWFGSPKFVRRYGDLLVPTTVTSRHPRAARRRAPRARSTSSSAAGRSGFSGRRGGTTTRSWSCCAADPPSASSAASPAAENHAAATRPFPRAVKAPHQGRPLLPIEDQVEDLPLVLREHGAH